MKKKGFTLIELLAVIVILAIIALITLPLITGVVERVRKGAAISSARGYIDAVEKYTMLHNVDSTNYPYDLVNNTWNINEETTIPSLNSFITIKGKKPTRGIITISEKGIVTNAELRFDNYSVRCDKKDCGIFAPKVKYNPNGGTGTMEDTENEIASNTFTKKGFIFKEWNTKADGSGETYMPSSTNISSDLTLYAIWEKVFTEFSLNYATKNDISLTIEASSTLDNERNIEKILDNSLDAFNGCWHSTGGTSHYIDFTFEDEVIINSFNLTNRANFTPAYAVKDFQLQALNDNNEWITLQSFVNGIGSGTETHFDVTYNYNKKGFNKYRINITSGHDNGYISIGEMNFELLVR